MVLSLMVKNSKHILHKKSLVAITIALAASGASGEIIMSLLDTGDNDQSQPLHTHTHTHTQTDKDKQTSDENNISAVHSIHLVEIIVVLLHIITVYYIRLHTAALCVKNRPERGRKLHFSDRQLQICDRRDTGAQNFNFAPKFPPKKMGFASTKFSDFRKQNMGQEYYLTG